MREVAGAGQVCLVCREVGAARVIGGGHLQQVLRERVAGAESAGVEHARHVEPPAVKDEMQHVPAFERRREPEAHLPRSCRVSSCMKTVRCKSKEWARSLRRRKPRCRDQACHALHRAQPHPQLHAHRGADADTDGDTDKEADNDNSM